MKVLIIGNANESHILKWIKGLTKRKIDVFLFTFNPIIEKNYKGIQNLKLYSLNYDKSVTYGSEGKLIKLTYLKALPKLKRIIKNFKPDILHAHYATGYGLLGALTFFKPYVISVWGDDVYSFPSKSFIHKFLLKFNLSKANAIFSTSEIMKSEIEKYTGKNIEVTPFGVDIEAFKKTDVKSIFSENEIVLGNIKKLEPKYGIEVLIRAFAKLKNKVSEIKVKLLIVGEGTLKEKLVKLSKDLNVNNEVIFTGFINHNDVPLYHNMIDIFCATSVFEGESFGVAIVEAMSCETPVIVSKIGGLTEVVKDNYTGFIVTPNDIDAISDKMELLVRDENLRNKFGINGRQRVLEKYDWEKNLDSIIKMYNEILINS